MAPPDRNAEPDDLPDADVDARWSDIVARLGDVEEAGRTTGAQPIRSDGPDKPAEPTAPIGPAPSTPYADGPRDWPSTPETEAFEEADSHFVPPEPEPVAHRDPLATLTWTIVVAVPVLAVLWVVVQAALPGLSLPAWALPVAGTAFVVSVAVLVWRMPPRRDPDDDDPGAIV
jgi:hypothetical protein